VVVVLFLPEGIVGGLQQLFRRRKKPPAGAIAGALSSGAQGGN
jgi:hypothetical protein